MTNILHTAAAAAAGAAALALFLIPYHLYDDKSYNQTKSCYDSDIAYIVNYPIHIFLPFLNIIKSINAITARAAIRPIILSPPVSAAPIWYIIRDTA